MSKPKAQQEPLLIAQRTKRNRITAIGLFGVPLLVFSATLLVVAKEYLRNPTQGSLIAMALLLTSDFIFAPLVVWILVPKVEFFDRHLTIRSWAGRWREHDYHEIDVMAIQHNTLLIIFEDRDQIALTPAEIDLSGLVDFLGSRDVTAAQGLLSVEPVEDPRENLRGQGLSLPVVPPPETSSGQPRRTRVSRAAGEGDPTSSEVDSTRPAMSNSTPSRKPLLTAQRPRRKRIVIAGWLGVFLLGLVFTILVTVRQYLVNPTQDHLMSVVLSLAVSCVWPYLVATTLVPKVDFFDRHLVARSRWGRSRRRDYREIDTIELKSGVLFINFKDRSRITLFRSQSNFEEIARFLASRDVPAALALPWVRRFVEHE